MNPRYIDCTSEVSAPRALPDTLPRWLAADIREDDWLVLLGDDAKMEIAAIAQFIESNPLQNLQRSVADFEIPALRQHFSTMRARLNQGVGFAVLDRLPVDDFALETLVEIYWLLGQLIGPPVAQKWNGEMIYSVKDTGKRYEYGVRGSHTAVELVFHADNAFGVAMPEHVGLFCRNPAKSGGISRFCCLATLHDRLLNQHPEVMTRLYQPMYFDRQKEHAEGAPPVCLAPFFSWNGSTLKARANTSLVRKGYEVIGERMDPELITALDAVDNVSNDTDLWFEAALERGQIQYLNNHRTAHYRSEFVDFEEPELKRHLFRLWHRASGSACYDGVQPV